MKHLRISVLLACTAAAALVASPQPAAADEPSQQPPPPVAKLGEDPGDPRSIWRPDFPPRRAVVKLGGDLGLLYWSEGGPWGPDKGIGHAMNPGFNTAVRASVEVTRWFAVDGRFHVGFASAKKKVAGNAGFLTIGGFVGPRFTLPFKAARPYLVVGPGVYDIILTGSGPTQLYGTTAWAITGGLGLEIPVTRRFSFGAEYLFHRLGGEKFSNNSDIEGGDPVTLNAFAQAAF